MALLFLTTREDRKPIPPNKVAEYLEISPSYLAKIFTELGKVNILDSHRGTLGGVTLSREPSTITLLEIVSTFQGQLGEKSEEETTDSETSCAFHRALVQLSESMRSVLVEWTLEDLAAEPCPVGYDPLADTCRLAAFCPKRRSSDAPGN